MQFRSFCSKYHITPFPASPLTIRYFCAYLAHFQHIKHSTIKTYLAGIRLYHIESGHADPTNDELVHYLCTGIKQLQGATRLPITINILKTLKHELHVSTSITVYNKRLLWAAFTLAFYGFLRVSEFVAPSLTQYAPQSNLTVRDTTLQHNQIHLHIKQSKTNPFRASHTILIAATQTSTCPVRALHIYLKLRNQKQPTSNPLFIFEDGRFLTREAFTQELRHLLQNAGFQPTAYASHSFRIGAATTAAAAGLPSWLIQTLGRWSSDCYKNYIHCPSTTIENVPRQLARANTTAAPVWNPDKGSSSI